MIKLVILYLTVLISFSACSNYNDVDQSPTFNGDIKDTDSWYEGMNSDVLEMRVTIPEVNDYNCSAWDNPTGPLRPCTMDDIYNDGDANDDYRPVLHVMMETEGFNSPNEVMNAELKQKGKSTRANEQKSYRIKLDSKEDLYMGERTFQLGKHPYDDTRVRNKLAFDLFRTIPNITSLKTEFVHLQITENNMTSYGLFTHVESVGDEYLANRGWGSDDYLYKAQNFSFYLRSELDLDSKGKPLDPDAFDSILEIENGKDHSNVNQMLSELNSDLSEKDFETFFDKYFNRKNYLTWMASHLVMGNKDTISQNFYLYNPLHSNTFYFIPWDYDGAGRDNDRYAKNERGVGTWWGVPLHKQFLNIDKNREDLYAMADLLRSKYITPDIIQSYLVDYNKTIEKFLIANPDGDHLRYEKWYDYFWNTLIKRLDQNIANYKSEIGHPMPFFQGSIYDGTTLTLYWEESVDFEKDEIVYDVKIADSLTYHVDENGTYIGDLDNVIYTATDIPNDVIVSVDRVEHEIKIDLKPGSYYVQLISKEKLNNKHYQIGFGNVRQAFLVDGNMRSVKFRGLYEFIVE